MILGWHIPAEFLRRQGFLAAARVGGRCNDDDDDVSGRGLGAAPAAAAACS